MAVALIQIYVQLRCAVGLGVAITKSQLMLDGWLDAGELIIIIYINVVINHHGLIAVCIGLDSRRDKNYQSVHF